MNRIYCSIWNEKTRTFVAVSELVKRRGKRSSNGIIRFGRSIRSFGLKALTVALMMVLGSEVYALPQSGSVVAGNTSIASNSNSMTITQSSQNAAINWQSFNIAQGEGVRFVQPNNASVALNRVISSDPSSILGTLSANGKIFLINPNGILFGQSASVNVGGLVASTLNMSDSDFMANKYRFFGAGNGSVLNQGSIHADGGYVALLGGTVSNEGVISAKMGTVALAAGNAITLDVAGDGLLNVSVDQGAVNAQVQNGGLIQADGGQVVMTTQAAGNLLKTVVNNTGVIEAQTLENHNGTIRLLGDMQSGTVNVGGKLDASAPSGGNSGFVETSAANVKVTNGAKVTTTAAQGLTGSWLIDPADYTIAASGGDITGATLSSNLGTTDVTIQSTSGGSGTNGNVNINDTVSWSSHTLTLNAQNNININTAMNGSGTASLALQYGQGAVALGNTSTVNVNAPVNLPAGNHFSTKLGSDGSTISYTVMTDLGIAGSATGTDLQGINGSLSGNYALGANIDASATSSWNSGAGFLPIGNFSNQFTGIFDGLGHTINSLTINRPSTSYVGLFGGVSIGGIIRNVGIVGGSVSGNQYAGGLVGINYGTISNSYATSAMSGSGNIGGLVGNNYGGTISNSYATGVVSAGSNAGGFAGSNTSTGTISNSYATGAVSGSHNNVGGLVGDNTGTVVNSHATGAISAFSNVGGLVGVNLGGTISNSYATGAVSGTSYYVGGLVGENYGPINSSYATGAVLGNNYVGGLVGYGLPAGTISNSYAMGSVSGTDNVGGLVGKNYGGTMSHAYWNSDVISTGIGSGTTISATGLTTTQMQTASNFAGFNFTATPGATGNHWVMVDVDGTLNNAGGATGATYPVLASEYSTTINNTHQLQLMAMNLAGSYALTQNINAATTGTSHDVWSGSTFIPIGNNTTQFTGSLDGLGHTINTLTINEPTANYIGLFYASAGRIANVGMVGGSITGDNDVGGLVGYNNSGGSISNSYNTGAVTGIGSFIGGLVGVNSSRISNSYATGAVTGANGSVGGLAGVNSGGTISNSYATGTVQNASFSTGGLVGRNTGSISNSYATAAVTGSNSYVGGLVGYNYGTISNSYATGAVSGSAHVGGLIGANSGTVSGSFWDTTTSGQATSLGGLGMSTAEMQAQANFTSATSANGNVNPAWDFANTWVMYDGYTYPLLRSFMTPLTVTANNVIKFYDGSTSTSGNGGVYSTTPNGNLLGTASYSTNGTHAGNYTITPSGLYSNQQGYIISYVTGTLTINPYVLNLTGSRAYDSTLNVAASAFGINGTLTTGVNGETLTLSGSGSVGSKDVSAGSQAVTLGSLALGSGGTGSVSNYTLIGGTDTATITAAPVSFTGTRTYDSTLYIAAAAFGTNGTITTGVNGETLTLSGSGSVSSKDVSAGSQAVTLGSLALGSGGTGSVSNYTLIGGTDTATITAAPVSFTGTRTYDSTLYIAAAAFGTNGTITTGVNGETLTLSGSGSVSSKDVSAGSQTVTSNTLALTNSTGLASNYMLMGGTHTATITPQTLTATVTAPNKIYDGNITASPTLIITSGLVGSETVNVTGTATFNSKDVATANLVTVNSASLSNGNNGGLASNYSLASGETVAASITPAPLTATVTAPNKVYDGTMTATPTLTITGGLVGAETVTASGVATFNTKDVVTANLVTVNNTLLSNGNNGELASNYSLVSGETATSYITLKALTASALVSNKVYDGTTVAAPALSITGGLVGSEMLNVAGTGTFNSKDVVSANVVTVNSVMLSDGLNGGQASNYSVSAGQTAAASITPKTLTVSATADNKIYDGTTTTSASLLDNRLSGDHLTLVSSSANFNDKNVGTGKTVTVQGINVSGQDAGNYTANATASTSADITPASLTITANDARRNQGEPNPVFSAMYSGLQNGDTPSSIFSGALTLSTPATLVSESNNYPITPSGETPNYTTRYVNGVLTVLPDLKPAVTTAVALTSVNLLPLNKIEVSTVDQGTAAPVSANGGAASVPIPGDAHLIFSIPGLGLTVMDQGINLLPEM